VGLDLIRLKDDEDGGSCGNIRRVWHDDEDDGGCKDHGCIGERMMMD